MPISSPFLTCCPFAHADLARRHLSQTNSQERDEADPGVVCLDEDDRARRDRGQVHLRRYLVLHVDRSTVRPVRGVAHALEERLRVVRSRLDKRAHDAPADGRVPEVVRERGQERLVHGSACEERRALVVCEHVQHGIRLALDPERVPQGDITGDIVRLRLARIRDDVVVLWRGDGSHTLAVLAREERVPGREAVVRLRGVALKELLEHV